MSILSQNRIFLVGRANGVRVDRVGDTSVARFTVSTERAYQSADGSAVVERTPMPVTAFDGPDTADAARLKDGDSVYVVGRIRVFSFESATGETRSGFEVHASGVRIYDGIAVLPEGIG